MQDSGEKLSTTVVRLNRLVESRYGIDLLPYQIDPDHIADVTEYYQEKRMLLKRQLGESALAFSADYAKAYLISEAARMLLREIRPRRLSKKRKGQK